MGVRVTRPVAVALVAVPVLPLAVGHVLFGVANFRPTYPWAEGVAACVAGVALAVSLVVALRSTCQALVTACLGTLPLVAWFAYAVPVQRSSDAVFFWASVVIPSVTGLAAALLCRRGSPRAG